MSIVSNIINAIPGNFVSQNESNSGFDLGDTTFSDLLEKQMNIKDNSQNAWFKPSGFIPEISTIGEGINIQDLVTASNYTKNIQDSTVDSDNNLASSEMIAFMSKPFGMDSSNENNNGLLNFAQKHAANFYTKCASNVVTDLAEFVEDTLKLS